MKGRGGRRNFEIVMFCKRIVGGLDFGEGGFFGFVGDREAGEVIEGGEMRFLAFFGQIFGEAVEIGFQGGLEDGVVGLVSLDNN